MRPLVTLCRLVAIGSALAGPLSPLNAAETAKGKLEISFLYMPPTEIEPTYHTAIWLEDKRGQMVKTLFVSQELSGTEYKVGDACPDWVKQAHWEKAEKSAVDAVTGPTPNVGSGSFHFDLEKLGVAPGEYEFRFQVHIIDKYNILFRGTITVGHAADEANLEVFYSPAKPAGASDLVRDVQLRYVP
ncbi:MAG: hypothetical protein C5B51_15405 [Terriglobia bacterium]|nr:MAG: hypothetical protein C5B51_15405 [Terriglobia bacterium]